MYDFGETRVKTFDGITTHIGRKMEGVCIDGINKLSTISSSSSSSVVVIVVKYVGINQRPRHRVGSDGAGSSIHGIAISKITILKYQGLVEPLNQVISSSFNSVYEPSFEAHHQGPLYISLMFFCNPEALTKYTQLGSLVGTWIEEAVGIKKTSSGLIAKVDGSFDATFIVITIDQFLTQGSFYRSWFLEEIVKIARNTTPLDNWSADGLTADGGNRRTS
ncbi:hypothetical protein V1478_006181 [Vespula squamosa]|uniref:Uncharacterized protein n=1 Tax=Vespula squamosa TaxID=30214 RepID=A0ABD2B755_VESSQ